MKTLLAVFILSAMLTGYTLTARGAMRRRAAGMVVGLALVGAAFAASYLYRIFT